MVAGLPAEHLALGSHQFDRGIVTCRRDDDLASDIAGFAAEPRDGGRDVFGLRQLEGLRVDDAVGHPGGGDGGDHVDFDVAPLALVLEAIHQAEHRRLRRAIVRLAVVTDEPRARSGEYDAPVLAFQEMRPCRLGDIAVPSRCTFITSSKSSRSILTKLLSRKMPALLTTMSSRPYDSSAVCTIEAAPARSATSHNSRPLSRPLP